MPSQATLSTFRKRMPEGSPDDFKHASKKNIKRGSAASLIKGALADPQILEMSRLVAERRSACLTEMKSTSEEFTRSEAAARKAYFDAVAAHEATGQAMSSRRSDYELEKVKVERHRELVKSCTQLADDGMLPYAQGTVAQAVQRVMPNVAKTEKHVKELHANALKDILYDLYEGGISLNREMQEHLQGLLNTEDEKLLEVYLEVGVFIKTGKSIGGAQLQVHHHVGTTNGFTTKAKMALRLAILLGIDWTEEVLGRPFYEPKTSPMKLQWGRSRNASAMVPGTEKGWSHSYRLPTVRSKVALALFASPAQKGSHGFTTPKSAWSQPTAQDGFYGTVASPWSQAQQGVAIRLNKLDKLWQPEDVHEQVSQGFLQVEDGNIVEEIDLNSQSLSGEALEQLFGHFSTLNQCVRLNATNLLATMESSAVRDKAMCSLVTSIVRHCSNLEDLILCNANLGGERAKMLKEVTDLENLQGIDVTKCGLSDARSLQGVLGVLPNLKRLFMSDNRMCATAQDVESVGELISEHKNLEVLECGNLTNGCESVDFSPIFDAITVLSRKDPSTTGGGFLKHLDISGMEIKTNKALAVSLKSLNGLETLVLNYTCIADDETLCAVLGALRGKVELRVLKLAGCLELPEGDTDIWNEDYKALSGLKKFFQYMPGQMEELDVSGMDLTTDALIQCLTLLGFHKSLQKLDLSGNNKVGSGVVDALANVRNLPKLEWVNVSETDVDRRDLIEPFGAHFHFGDVDEA